jgi:hypothetical protein
VANRELAKHVVEVLTFPGCPHAQPAIELAERVVAEADAATQIRLVNVGSADAATRHRFLGSPSIRVDGRDIEPGADTRSDYGVLCRIYQTPHGVSGLPDERWLRQALTPALAN